VGCEDRIQVYSPALRRLALSYTRDHHESQDLFQEIAVALWKALPNYRGDSSERTFVYRVAHNTAIRFVSSPNRRATREQVALDVANEPVSLSDPERDAIRNQQWQKLWRAVRELPVIDRQIVMLRLEGLSMAEVAEVTGFTEAAVAMRFSRVRRRLTEEISEAGKERA
jgi:RNA polymerase sigma-70 factor (ECF subfamily)